VGNTLTVHFQAGDDPVRHRKLVVYSLQGHEVISRDIAGDQKDITLDMSRLNKGMYIVNIHTGKAIKQFKFIK
ncbi:MAG: T9SS type A sorting domain-containing protein, partial [Cytophagales bacterium]|nr:T9SS type A sorting domain-containing protein [Cytophagales bacterium]